MRKFIKWFLITMLSLFLLLVILIVIAVNLNYTYEVDLYTTDTAKRPFVIPVEIEGKTYPFVWDTGASASFLDYKFAKELNFEGDTVILHNISTVRDNITDSIAVKKIKIRIGDLSINTEFMLDGYKRYFIPLNQEDIYSSIYDTTTFVGTIGQNIISNFYWLFDFKKNNVKFSQDPIDNIPANTDDNIFKIKFTDKDFVPATRLIINERDTFSFRFDTGYRSVLSFELLDSAFPLNPLFAISNTLHKHLENNHTSISIISDEIPIHLQEALKINKEIISYVTSISPKDHYRNDNYITSNFPYRYRMMYYDPKNKEISFYISPQDSNYVYRGDNEKIIINNFVEQYMDSINKEQNAVSQ